MNFVKTFSLVLLMSAANSFAADFNGFPSWRDVAASSAENAKKHVLKDHPVAYGFGTATVAIAAATATAYANSETVKSKVDAAAEKAVEYSKEGLEMAKIGIQYVKDNTTKTHVAAATGAAVLGGTAIAYQTGHLKQAADAVKNFEYAKTADAVKTSVANAASSTMSAVDGNARIALGYAKVNPGRATAIVAGVLAVPAAAYAGYKYLTSESTPEDYVAVTKEFMTNLSKEQRDLVSKKYGTKVKMNKLAEDQEFTDMLSDEQQATLLSIVEYKKSLKK